MTTTIIVSHRTGSLIRRLRADSMANHTRTLERCLILAGASTDGGGNWQLQLYSSDAVQGHTVVSPLLLVTGRSSVLVRPTVQLRLNDD